MELKAVDVTADDPPKEQLEVFESVVNGAGVQLALPPVLDVEARDTATLKKRFHNATSISSQHDGGDCILYINPNDLNRLGRPSGWARRLPLWLARYNGAPGNVVEDGYRIAMHQYTGTGRVSWYAKGQSDIDLNVYDPDLMPWVSGSVDGLNQLRAENEQLKGEVQRLQGLQTSAARAISKVMTNAGWV